MPNYITEYYEKIMSGEIVAGEWIKTWYGMVVEGIRSGKYVFSAPKANKVIRFIQELCHHSKGRNDLITLELWQNAMVSVCFGILAVPGGCGHHWPKERQNADSRLHR